MKNKYCITIAKRVATVAIFCLCLATQAWGLGTSVSSINLASSGTNQQLTATVNVTAGGSWTITSNVDWLRFNTPSGTGDGTTTLSGSGNGSFTVRALANEGAERAGVVTVREGNNTRTIAVAQDWGYIEVGGIRYGHLYPNNISDLTIGVVSKSGGYSGNIVIPYTVVYQGRTYYVERITTRAMYNNNNLRSVYISDGVKIVGDYAFWGIELIHSIRIPPTLQSLNDQSLLGCQALTSIKLPRTIINIGRFAFYESFDLTTIEVGWDIPLIIYRDNFEGAYSNVTYTYPYAQCTLVVPPGKKPLYQAAERWKKFPNMVEASYSASTHSVTLAAAAVPQSVAVTTNAHWNASTTSNWLTVTTARNNGNITDLGNGTINISATQNTTAMRTGKVYITNLNGTAVDSITVVQYPVQNIDVSPDSIFLYPTGQDHELTDTISVASTGAWTVTMNVDWLTLGNVAGDGSNFPMTSSGGRNITLSGNGNGRFTVRAFGNGGADREGALTITAGVTTKTITVMQDWHTIVVDGITYGRRNPGKPSDPYISVLRKNFGDNYYSGDIVIPDNVIYKGKAYIPESVGGLAFVQCINLTSVVLPNSIKEIGEGAFGGSENMTSINIPESLASLGDNAFESCNSLTSAITIPATLTYIPSSAFLNCHAIPSVTLHNSITDIGTSAFRGCGSLTSVTIPNSVSVIKGATFMNCGNLTSMIIPNSVTKIEGLTFMGCGNLASVTIPSSVTTLGEFIFHQCASLQTVEVGWDTPPNAGWYYGTFAECSIFDGRFAGESWTFDYANCTLIVPQGRKELYKAAPVWERFGANIKEKVSPDSLSFVGAGAVADLTDSVFVTTNVAWQITDKDAWLTVAPMAGTGSDTLVVTAAVNSTGAERTGGFVFANAVTNGTNDSIRIKVKQESNLYLSKDSIIMEANASDTTVELTCYVPWTVYVPATDWLTVDLTSGNAPATLTISATENDSIPRSADVVITYDGTEKILHVAQCPNPVITVEPSVINAAPLSVTTVTVHVTVFAAWTVTIPVEHSSWLRISAPEGAGGGTSLTFTIAVFPNLGAARETDITIDNGITTKKIHVAQPAGPLL